MKEFLKEFFYFLLHGRSREDAVQPEPDELERAYTEMGGDKSVVIFEIPDEPVFPVKQELPRYEPEKAVIDPNKVFQLSEKQFESMQKGANIGGVAWSIPLPREADDAEHYASLVKLNKEVEELIALELIQDVSDKFGEQVSSALKFNKRHVRLFILTEMAEQMFKDNEAYIENDEVKHRKRVIN